MVKPQISILDRICDGVRAHCALGQPITDEALDFVARLAFPHFAEMPSPHREEALGKVAAELRAELGDTLAADWEAQIRAPKPHLMPQG